LMYHVADGTGRDTHVFNIHTRQHDRNLNHFKKEEFTPWKTGF
jgi:hypothetical protein